MLQLIFLIFIYISLCGSIIDFSEKNAFSLIKNNQISWSTINNQEKRALDLIIENNNKDIIDDLFGYYFNKTTKALVDKKLNAYKTNKTDLDMKITYNFFNMVFTEIRPSGKTLFQSISRNSLKTAVKYLKYLKKNEQAELLVKYLNTTDSNGNTPFHSICAKDHKYKYIENFLILGANPFALNNDNKYPIQEIDILEKSFQDQSKFLELQIKDEQRLKNQIKDDFYTTFYGSLSFILYSHFGNFDEFFEIWTEAKITNDDEVKQKRFTSEIISSAIRNSPKDAQNKKKLLELFYIVELLPYQIYNELFNILENQEKKEKDQLKNFVDTKELEIKRTGSSNNLQNNNNNFSDNNDNIDNTVPKKNQVNIETGNSNSEETKNQLYKNSLFIGTTALIIGSIFLYFYLKKYHPHLLPLQTHQ